MNYSNRSIKNTLTTAILSLSLLVQGCNPKQEEVSEVSGTVMGKPELTNFVFDWYHYSTLRFPVRLDSGQLIEDRYEFPIRGSESTILNYLKEEIEVGDKVIIEQNPKYTYVDGGPWIRKLQLKVYNPNYPKIIKKSSIKGETKWHIRQPGENSRY